MIADVSTLEEAADYLRITPALLRRKTRAHEIAFVQQGRVLTFRREALEAYLVGREVPALAPNNFGLTQRSAARLTKTTG